MRSPAVRSAAWFVFLLVVGTPASASVLPVSRADLDVAVFVRPETERRGKDLNIMTYNLWYGGTQVNNYHEKQVRFIRESGADIVGLQEASTEHIARLGKGLGWYYSERRHERQSVGVISRYPIVEEYDETSHARGMRINLGGNDEINFWDVHLNAYPYGPYDFCFRGKSEREVMLGESTRESEIRETLRAIEPQLRNKDRIPVILVGDFNAPSHEDWIAENSEYHCGVKRARWPTSVLPKEKGFIDSYRSVHDATNDRAITWSPIVKANEEGLKDGNGNLLPEPQDRIDFIYHAGRRLEVLNSTMLHGKETPREMPNHANNEWTSDHNAVLTKYRLYKGN